MAVYITHKRLLFSPFVVCRWLTGGCLLVADRAAVAPAVPFVLATVYYTTDDKCLANLCTVWDGSRPAGICTHNSSLWAAGSSVSSLKP